MSKIVKFYDKKLSIIQRNAKRLAKHNVLSNIENIRDQLALLRSKHRRFIFAFLAEKYGDDRARDLAQLKIVKDRVDAFEDLDALTIRQIEAISMVKRKAVNITDKLKHSFYYRHIKPQQVREETLLKIKDEMPDLVSPPKTKKSA